MGKYFVQLNYKLPGNARIRHRHGCGGVYVFFCTPVAVVAGYDVLSRLTAGLDGGYDPPDLHAWSLFLARDNTTTCVGDPSAAYEAGRYWPRF